MWKQWKKAAVVLMACTMLLNMTGCKKQEEKLKEPQTEQKTRQKDEKEAESKEETIPANQNRSCRPVRDSNWKTSGCSYGEQS